jgi:hypothetical protein
MSENDIVDGSEKPNLPSPWYRCKWLWIVSLLLLLVVSVYQYIHYHFYRPIEVTYEPWQVLDPGRAVGNPLKFEVVEEGSGPLIEPGDLIQTSHWRWSPEEKKIERRDDVWWMWVGFRAKDETPFYAMNLRLHSALVGQREGVGLKFTESPRGAQSPSHAGKVYVNPFGSFDYYAGKKSGYSDKSTAIYIPFSPDSGYTIVHIKKVLKGQLKYRTIHLYDGTWFERCSWWNGIRCEVIKDDPRESWSDEARYDGMSADGTRATFQYGPVNTPGRKEQGGPGGWEQSVAWAKNEWKKLPIGVQVE